MVVAYVTVKSHTGQADRLRSEIEAIQGVEYADIVAGDVDFIAKVDVDSTADIKDIAADSIQQLHGVEDTTTYVAIS
ncbi:MAG: Lrp/AsnC ligand binding domain-containing protein [Natronomonas sp.]